MCWGGEEEGRFALVTRAFDLEALPGCFETRLNALMTETIKQVNFRQNSLSRVVLR